MTNSIKSKNSEKQDQSADSTDSVLEKVGLNFLSSRGKTKEFMSLEWKQEREKYLKQIHTKKNLGHLDWVKQGENLFKELKANPAAKKIQEKLTTKIEKESIDKLKTLQQLFSMNTTQRSALHQEALKASEMPQTMDEMCQKADQYEKSLKANEKEKLMKIAADSAGNLNDVFGVILRTCPPRVRNAIANPMGISFDEAEMGEIKQVSDKELKECPVVMKSFVNIGKKEEDELVDAIHIIVKELQKETEEKQSTSKKKTPAVKNGMKAFESLYQDQQEVEEAGRGNLTDAQNAPRLPHTGMTRWVERINEFGPWVAGGIRRALVNHPRLATLIPYILSLLIAIIYQVVYKLSLFEAVRTYGAAQASAHIMFMRNVTVNGTSTLFPPAFRPGAWNDQNGTLAINEPQAYTFSAFVLFWYAVANLILFFRANFTNNVYARESSFGLFMVAATVLFLMVALMLGSPGNLLNALIIVAELFNVFLALIFRVTLQMFLYIRNPLPSSRFEVVAMSLIYVIGQIPTVRYMQTAVRVATGIYGDQAAFYRIVANSLAEIMIPISTWAFASRWNGFTIELMPWWPDPTPQQPRPFIRRTQRLAHTAFSLHTIVWDIYAAVFGLGFAFLDLFEVTTEGIIYIVVCALMGVAIYLAVLGDVDPTNDPNYIPPTNPNPALLDAPQQGEDQRLDPPYTPAGNTNLVRRDETINEVRPSAVVAGRNNSSGSRIDDGRPRDEGGKLISKENTRKRISAHKPYSAYGQLYQNGQPGYGEIDRNGLQVRPESIEMDQIQVDSRRAVKGATQQKDKRSEQNRPVEPRLNREVGVHRSRTDTGTTTLTSDSVDLTETGPATKSTKL